MKEIYGDEIEEIINENIDINKLLVVTFTNAAASEMRERVLDAIYKKLEEDPENENLQRQITLLNMASICTIDSFCLEVVKNNFYELENMSPNFRIADTTEIELLKEEVLEDFRKIDEATESKELKEIIKVKYTAPDGIDTSKSGMKKGIIYKAPLARVSSFQALDDEQTLEKNKIVAKLTIFFSGLILPL